MDIMSICEVGDWLRAKGFSEKVVAAFAGKFCVLIVQGCRFGAMAPQMTPKGDYI